MTNRKKTFIALAIIILLIILGFLYYLFQKGNPSTNTTDNSLPSFGGGAGDFNSNNGNGSSGNGTANTGNGKTPVAFPLIEASRNNGVPIPVSGAVSFERGKNSFIRYIERGTGHVFESWPEGQEEVKISNTTIPKIYEGIWQNDGQVALVRYTKEDNPDSILTFYEKFKNSTSTDGKISGTLESNFLEPNINEVAMGPGNKIFYLTIKNDSAIGTVSLSNGTQKRQAFTSPITGWLATWPSDKAIYLTTKPSASAQGYSYLLNPDTLQTTKILGEIPGLTIIPSKDGSKILYSMSTGDGIALYLYKTKTGQTVKMPFDTLAEKCIWSKDNVTVYCGVPSQIETGEYPDLWYQGLVSFGDLVWKANTETGKASYIFNPFLLGTKIDSNKFFLSQNENYLFFINKIDSILWSLKLK